MGSEEKKKNKNDIAWEKLFEEHKILESIENKSVFKIKSADINKYRESRLMAKFDREHELPQIFKANNLSILPIGRGEYIIGRFKTHKEFPKKHSIKPKIMKLPQNFSSIDTKNITSESVAINVAFASGMVDDVLNGNDLNKSYLTVSGRMSSKSLSFKIDSKVKGESAYDIEVKKSQIEIDSAFENEDAVLLIEAKINEKKDFIIRQIYYPYLFLKNRIEDKYILPVIFIYSEGSFIFHIYKFTDDNNYSSIKIVETKEYKLSNEINISLNEVINIMRNVNIVEDRYTYDEANYIPFPQANTFSIVLNLIEFISSNDKTKRDIELKYGFAYRQAQYYHNALRFLGYSELADKNKIVKLTTLGKEVLKSKNTKVGKLQITEDILKDRIMNEAMRITMNQRKLISKKDAYELLERNSELGEDTKERRASSIRNWLLWILSNTDKLNEFEI
ncbi:type II restriction enzyme [Mammaliicoccus sciuri]|uniref:type II restriction enzyme n=2 Tax=Mammaliicoccus sciuri TaxID=1296 RepID=UPI001E2DF956|nr:hypothetical protein [Mammaliicoccus sciuri]MCD8762824.1 hypothetical protein [Mammaliicoccus sciuri]